MTSADQVREAEIGVLIGVLEMAYFEAKVAFEGLENENVWKRPAPGLLSAGELAGHIAYWQAVRLAGDGGQEMEAGRTECRVNSPLIDRRFRYFTTMIASSPAEQHLAMTAEQVGAELVRVHEESVADFRARIADLHSTVPGGPPDYTYGEMLKYAAFHVAYHTGQMYSARHLLGEKTPDN